jgi:hypothetical protein
LEDWIIVECLLQPLWKFFTAMETLEYLPECLIIRVTHKERMTSHELDINASYSPDIYRLAIVDISHQKLRGSIPPCGNVICKLLIFRLNHGPGETEITDLEHSILGKQHILRLDVSVYDVVRVDKGTCFQDLPDDLFCLQKL